jgi:ankyrin repeat protein
VLAIWQDEKTRYTALHSLCASGCADATKVFLEKLAVALGGYDVPDFRDMLKLKEVDGRTPLYLAVFGNHLATVKEILDVAEKSFASDLDGLQLFLRDGDQSTAGTSLLYLAYAGGRFEIADLLLKSAQRMFAGDKNKFIDFITQKGPAGKTALQEVCNQKNGAEATAKLLALLQGICANDKDKFLEIIMQADVFGSAPLHYACTSGGLYKNAETVAKLLQSAQEMFANDPNKFLKFITQKNSQGKTPLSEAFKSGKGDVARCLLEATKKVFKDCKATLIGFINPKEDADENTLLHIACKCGDGRTVLLLLKEMKGIFPEDFLIFIINKKNKFGETPADLARKNGHDAIVKHLERLTNPGQGPGLSPPANAGTTKAMEVAHTGRPTPVAARVQPAGNPHVVVSTSTYGNVGAKQAMAAAHTVTPMPVAARVGAAAAVAVARVGAVRAGAGAGAAGAVAGTVARAAASAPAPASASTSASTSAYTGQGQLLSQGNQASDGGERGAKRLRAESSAEASVQANRAEASAEASAQANRTEASAEASAQANRTEVSAEAVVGFAGNHNAMFATAGAAGGAAQAAAAVAPTGLSMS